MHFLLFSNIHQERKGESERENASRERKATAFLPLSRGVLAYLGESKRVNDHSDIEREEKKEGKGEREKEKERKREREKIE